MCPVCVIRVTCRVWGFHPQEGNCSSADASIHGYITQLQSGFSPFSPSSTICCYTASRNSAWEVLNIRWGLESASMGWRSWKQSMRTTLILSKCLGRRGHLNSRPGTVFRAALTHNMQKLNSPFSTQVLNTLLKVQKQCYMYETAAKWLHPVFIFRCCKSLVLSPFAVGDRLIWTHPCLFFKLNSVCFLHLTSSEQDKADWIKVCNFQLVFLFNSSFFHTNLKRHPLSCLFFSRLSRRPSRSSSRKTSHSRMH